MLRIVLSYSRKAYSEAVTRQDTETFRRLSPLVTPVGAKDALRILRSRLGGTVGDAKGFRPRRNRFYLCIRCQPSYNRLCPYRSSSLCSRCLRSYNRLVLCRNSVPCKHADLYRDQRLRAANAGGRSKHYWHKPVQRRIRLKGRLSPHWLRLLSMVSLPFIFRF
jgi:hypothetical protein